MVFLIFLEAPLTDNLLKIKRKKGYNLIDFNGELKLKNDFRKIYTTHNSKVLLLKPFRPHKARSYRDVNYLYHVDHGFMPNEKMWSFGLSDVDGTNNFTFKENNRWGLYDFDANRVLIKPKYLYMKASNLGFIVGNFNKRNKKSNIYNFYGELLYKSPYQVVRIVDEEYALVRKNKKHGVINFKTGELVVKPVFEDSRLELGTFIVRSNI